jgi:hypothetical protein
MIRSSSSGRVRAASSADLAASSAMVAVLSSGAATRRSRIPVRERIHSSVVSTIRSRSWFLSTFAGA